MEVRSALPVAPGSGRTLFACLSGSNGDGHTEAGEEAEQGGLTRGSCVWHKPYRGVKCKPKHGSLAFPIGHGPQLPSNMKRSGSWVTGEIGNQGHYLREGTSLASCGPGHL